jgi:hypothetical protein
MIDVDQILKLHAETVALWHQAPVENASAGWLGLVCQQHLYNYELWHQEDIARATDVSEAEIAQVKRRIDKLNQQRNDGIEKLDDAITEQLAAAGIAPQAGARQNTETPGSAIDRLSIMALRIYHYDEQLERTDVDSEHLARVQQRAVLCREQQRDLAQGLRELLEDIFAGRKRHKTYRQMKMYNDPTLNPYLYKRAGAAAPDAASSPT